MSGHQNTSNQIGVYPIYNLSGNVAEYWVFVHGYQGTLEQVKRNEVMVAKLIEMANAAGIIVVQVDYAHGQPNEGSIYDYANEIALAIKGCHSDNVTVVVHSTGEPPARLAVMEYHLHIKKMISFDGVTTGLTERADYYLNFIPGNNFNSSTLFLRQLRPDSAVMQMLRNSSPDYTTLRLKSWQGAVVSNDFGILPEEFGSMASGSHSIDGLWFSSDHLQVIQDPRALTVAINWTLYNRTAETVFSHLTGDFFYYYRATL